MAEALEEVSKTTSVYPDTQGYPPLREYIAKRLAHKRDMDVTPDEVLLTEGLDQAIHFVVEALVNPVDVVIVDDFVNGGTLWSLNRFRSDISGVDSDADAMLEDALETTIDESLAAGRNPR